MQICKILRILALAPLVGLLGFSSVFAEVSSNNLSPAYEEYIKQSLEAYHVPWDDAHRSFLEGDYVSLQGRYYFVKEVQKTEADVFSIHQEMRSKLNSLREELQWTSLPSAFIDHLGSIAMLQYSKTANSSTAKSFKGFEDQLGQMSTKLFNNPVDTHIGLDSLQRKRETLIKSAGPWTKYVKNNLAKDLKNNSTTLISSAAIYFTISALGEIASNHHKEKQGTNFCYTVSPKGQAYILSVHQPTEAEEFLFKGINKHGRIKPHDFLLLQEHGCSEVGGKVIPGRSVRSRARDAVAITLGKVVEVTLDTAFTMVGQHRGLVNIPPINLTVSETSFEGKSGYGLVPNKIGWGQSIANGFKGFGSMFLYGTGTFIYLGVKEQVKRMVGNQYRNYFPKYDIKEVEPKEQPLGIASVDKEFRYIYPNYENEQCQLETNEKPDLF
ncbi:MAG: hypothetical protein AB8G05_09510 [Oligoflexales bacterium]